MPYNLKTKGFSSFGLYIQSISIKYEHKIKIFSDVEISKILSLMHPLLGSYSKMSELTKKEEDMRIQATVDPTQEKDKSNL